jgi:hypothetical protein
MLPKLASILAPVAKEIDDVPITTPELFQTIIETVTGTVLGFTVATAVV